MRVGFLCPMPLKILPNFVIEISDPLKSRAIIIKRPLPSHILSMRALCNYKEIYGMSTAGF